MENCYLLEGCGPSDGSNPINGAKNATSRYSHLKDELDDDSINHGAYLVTTKDMAASDIQYGVVDLFSGAGGISQGLREAGFKKLLSVELDKDASATIRKNFHGSNHIEGEIEKVSESQVLDAVAGKKVHLVIGGPPCNGFSVAGLRKPDDPRNQLFREFIRIVKIIQPDYAVMENVPGILTMQKGKVYKEIIRQFEKAGYPGMSVRILESATFGAPQLRARAIFVANKHGLPNPYPEEIYSKQEYKTIESAIGDLADVGRNEFPNHEWTNHSKKFIERISAVQPGSSLYKTFRDAYKRQHKGVPSMTVKENHGGCHIHYELNRVLSAREMARLQTFPDSYIFEGTMKRVYWQIGNAVPCIMARHIGFAVRHMLDLLYNGSIENADYKPMMKPLQKECLEIPLFI